MTTLNRRESAHRCTALGKAVPIRFAQTAQRTNELLAERSDDKVAQWSSRKRPLGWAARRWHGGVQF
ncbi:hypothetical protein [uncultured Mycobacterium sp.]|uniref:hypothetical protein n=1 Tax=uncultured Mycobacterium sp. TaxID=171292 RepID=UPI0035CA60D9